MKLRAMISPACSASFSWKVESQFHEALRAGAHATFAGASFWHASVGAAATNPQA